MLCFKKLSLVAITERLPAQSYDDDTESMQFALQRVLAVTTRLSFEDTSHCIFSCETLTEDHPVLYPAKFEHDHLESLSQRRTRAQYPSRQEHQEVETPLQARSVS